MHVHHGFVCRIVGNVPTVTVKRINHVECVALDKLVVRMPPIDTVMHNRIAVYRVVYHFRGLTQMVWSLA